MENTYQSMETKIENLKIENSIFKKQVNDLNIQNQELVEQNLSLRDEVEDWKKQFNDLKKTSTGH
jgi:FtsZ-binding cell division protein ZapB